MIEWIIQPKQSIGPIKLGMEKKEVNEVLGSDYFHKKLIMYPGLTQDQYYKRTISIIYSDDLKVEAIEIIRPYKVIYRGYDLLKESIEEIRKILREAEVVIAEDTERISCPEEGICILKNEKDPSRIFSVSLIADGLEEKKQKKLEQYRNRPKMTIADLRKKYGRVKK